MWEPDMHAKPVLLSLHPRPRVVRASTLHVAGCGPQAPLAGGGGGACRSDPPPIACMHALGHRCRWAPRVAAPGGLAGGPPP